MTLHLYTETSVPTSYSTTPVVITSASSSTTTRVLSTCTASHSNVNWRYPCGLNTVCFTDLSTSDRVRCECASGYVGNASAGCTQLNVLINATRVLQGSLRFSVEWQTGLNDSTSVVYQAAVAQLMPLLEKLMGSVVSFVQNSVSPKKFR